MGVGKPKRYEGSWIHAMNEAGYSVAGARHAAGVSELVGPVLSVLPCTNTHTGHARQGQHVRYELAGQPPSPRTAWPLAGRAWMAVLRQPG